MHHYCIRRFKKGVPLFLAVDRGKLVWLATDSDKFIDFANEQSAELFLTLDHTVPPRYEAHVVPM